METIPYLPFHPHPLLGSTFQFSGSVTYSGIRITIRSGGFTRALWVNTGGDIPTSLPDILTRLQYPGQSSGRSWLHLGGGGRQDFLASKDPMAQSLSRYANLVLRLIVVVLYLPRI